jgi:hypothetical protein
MNSSSYRNAACFFFPPLIEIARSLVDNTLNSIEWLLDLYYLAFPLLMNRRSHVMLLPLLNFWILIVALGFETIFSSPQIPEAITLFFSFYLIFV